MLGSNTSRLNNESRHLVALTLDGTHPAGDSSHGPGLHLPPQDAADISRPSSDRTRDKARTLRVGEHKRLFGDGMVVAGRTAGVFILVTAGPV